MDEQVEAEQKIIALIRDYYNTYNPEADQERDIMMVHTVGDKRLRINTFPKNYRF